MKKKNFKRSNFFFLFSKFILISLLKTIISIFLKFDNNISLFLLNKYYILFVSNFFRNSSFFLYNQLIDYTAVEQFNNFNKNILSLNFLSIYLNSRLNIMLSIYNSDLINSLTSIYDSSNWSEREIFDMFGIFFKFHPDLRRILTDYGFLNYPLKKEYPLCGYDELFYSDNKKNFIFIKNKIRELNKI